jgi:hypothetical protein
MRALRARNHHSTSKGRVTAELTLQVTISSKFLQRMAPVQAGCDYSMLVNTAGDYFAVASVQMYIGESWERPRKCATIWQNALRQKNGLLPIKTRRYSGCS